MRRTGCFLIPLVAALCLTSQPVNAGLFDGLLVWHDFEDLVDDSGNGHDASLHGNANLTGGLLRLDGDGDYANIGTPASFGPLNPLVDALSDFTIALAYATQDDGTYSNSTSTVLLSIGPDSAAGAADFSLLTASDGQTIHIEAVTFITSRQSGMGYANGSVHLVIVTYDATLNLFTFYHLDDAGMAVSHGDSTVRAWDGDWSEQWDETLNYGVRLGAVRNSSLQGAAGLGDLTGGIDLFAIWDRVLDVSEMPLIPDYDPAPELAGNPSPPDETTDVVRDTLLYWREGVDADKHNVYFGTSFDDVNDAGTNSPLLVGIGQTETSYDPTPDGGLLDWGRTYYWRVDEVSGATVHKGRTWSFTVEPYLYPLTLGDQVINVTASSCDPNFGPVTTIDGSGLDADGLHAIYDPSDPNQPDNMWVSERGASGQAWIQYEFDRVYKLREIMIWNFNRDKEDRLGYGLKEVQIEYSADGLDFTALDPVELQQATGSAPVGPHTFLLDGILASHVRLIALSSFKNRRYGLSEVRLLYLPVQAFEPQPASGSEDVDPDVMLGWRAGHEAASHEVYLGLDMNDLPLAHTVSESSFAPEGLVLDQTYYWQVNEVNDAAIPGCWEGDLWHFTTSSLLVVDDFESYDNLSPDRVFQTWIDGYGFSPDDHFPQGHPGNGTGAAVGHDIWTPGTAHYNGDLMETTTVHGGRQSAPLYYNGMSEITRTFNPSQDWTVAAIRALTLYVHGQQDNGNGRFYVKINNSPARVIDNLDLTMEVWQEVNLDLADFNVNLQNVTNLTLGIDGNGTGLIFIDDVRLYPSRRIPEKVLGDLTGDCLVDAEDVAVIEDNWLLRPLAAEYTFDTGLLDTSGNMRHGTGRNNPVVQNGVLTLSGSNAMDIPLGAANPFDGTRDFSVAMNFRTNDPGLLLSSARDDNPDNHALAIYLNDDPDEPFWGEVVHENFQVGRASAEDDEFFYEFNQWHELVVTYDADNNRITVYLDGVAAEGEEINPAIPNIAADTVRLGGTLNTASPDVGNFVGSVDNVRIFNFTLTPDDVALLPRIPVIPGDLNQDGIVDQQDKDIVEANMGPVQLWP